MKGMICMLAKLFSTVTAALLALGLCPCIALADVGDDADCETGEAAEVGSDTTAPSEDATCDSLAAIPLAADDIDGGTIGTCTWTIDASGCLTIAPEDGVSGSFEMSSPSTSSWPWYRNSTKVLSAKVEPGVSASRSLAYMFSACPNLVSADLSGLDASGVTSMSYMFYNCYALTSLDLSGLDMSSVTSMSYMFRDCTSLASLCLGQIDASGVTSMYDMFYNCSSLSSLDMSGVDMSGVTDLSYMFYNCSSLSSLELSNLDMPNVSSMSYMFYNCSSLKALDLSRLDTWRVTSMSNLFSGCRSLVSIDVSSLDTSHVASMYNMFSGCLSLAALDLSGFDMSSVTDASSMFSSCTSLKSLDLSSCNASHVTSIYSMFYYCMSLVSLDLSGLETSNVTSMYRMFYNCSSLASLDLSGFDMSSVTDADSMFYNCSSLASLDLSSCNASRVASIYSMFYNCTSLVFLDLSGFGTSNVARVYSDHDLAGGDAITYADEESSPKNPDMSPDPSDSELFYSCSNLRVVVVGEGFSFTSSLPTPRSNGTSGRWMSGDGTIYDSSSALPNNVAATYTAVFPTRDGGWSPGYSDVTNPSDWYYDAVYGMTYLGCITGYTDDDGWLVFNHGGTMDRAQMATVLWRMAGEPAPSGSRVFKDVDYSDYYGDAVDWAFEAGVVTGYRDVSGDLIYDPSGALDFEALVTMTARMALGSEQAAEAWPQTVLADPRFTDAAAVDDWARGPMAWAIDEGMVTGADNGNGTFTIAPGDKTARGRGVTVLWRAYEAGVIAVA